MKSSAPDSRAITLCWSPLAVTITTGSSRVAGSARKRRQTSWPSMPPLDDRLRARSDHPGLSQAQRIEADRVLVVVLAPFVVWQLVHQREGVAELSRVATIHQKLSRPRGLIGAEIGRLQDRPKR